MGRFEVVLEKCVGCGECLPACPYDALELENNIVVVNEKCTLCGACIDSCPYDALVLLKTEKPTEHPQDYKGVMVVAEQKRGVIQSVSYELLGAARRLAEDIDCSVSAVLIGNNMSSQAPKLIAYGADKVFLVQSKALAYFSDEAYTKTLTRIIREQKPEIVLDR